MSVKETIITQYEITCNDCGRTKRCADGSAMNINTKSKAVKWAGMHKVKDGRVLCPLCYQDYIVEIREKAHREQRDSRLFNNLKTG